MHVLGADHITGHGIMSGRQWMVCLGNGLDFVSPPAYSKIAVTPTQASWSKFYLAAHLVVRGSERRWWALIRRGWEIAARITVNLNVFGLKPMSTREIYRVCIPNNWGTLILFLACFPSLITSIRSLISFLFWLRPLSKIESYRGINQGFLTLLSFEQVEGWRGWAEGAWQPSTKIVAYLVRGAGIA